MFDRKRSLAMTKSLLRAATLLCFSAVLFGQTTSLTGTVADPSGAVIPGATISIVNVETGAPRDAVSDTQGRYTMDRLTPGTYKLTAKASGFSDVVIDKVELLVNQPKTVSITFEKVGATKTTIEVAGEAAQVNTTDASLGNAIAGSAIVELPMFARNVVNLLQFQPGVTATGDGDRRARRRCERRQGGPVQCHAGRRGCERTERAHRFYQRAARHARLRGGIPHHHQ